jgi:hypothetical protein
MIKKGEGEPKKRNPARRKSERAGFPKSSRGCTFLKRNVFKNENSFNYGEPDKA